MVDRLDLERVDLLVAADDEERLLRVVGLEGVHGQPDALLDDAAHPEEDVLDGALLPVERPPRELNERLGDLALDGPEERVDLAGRGPAPGGRSWSVHAFLLPAQPKRPDT